MTVVEYKGKMYDYSWRSIGLFSLFCPLIAVFLVWLLEFLWIYSYLILVYPVCEMLNLMTGDTFIYALSFSTSSYIITVPGKAVAVNYVSECVGVLGYALYGGLVFATPRNKNMPGSEHFYRRKVITFVACCALLYFFNILRSIITLFLYYKGIFDINPMHEYIGYATTFLAVFLHYAVNYFLLPEYCMFFIWMKDDIKARIAKRRKGGAEDKESESINKKEVQKKYVWSVAIVIIMLFSIALIYLLFFS